jgi:hypothetical protein
VTTIYPVRPHRCDIGGPEADDVYVGVVRRCDVCGTWYVIKAGEYGNYWQKVHWYHRQARALIAEYYAKQKEVV